MAAAGEVARRTTSRRFQTRGRNAARDATTNPPRRGSLGGRATSARAFPTIACARASLAPPSVADARRALSAHPVGRGGGCGSSPRNHARRNLTTTISNYSASCSSARARRIKKRWDRLGGIRSSTSIRAKSPRSDWSRASIWGPGGRNGRGPVATAGALRPVDYARRDERRARGRASGRSRPRLTRPRERRGPANRTRGVERVARVGPGIGSAQKRPVF